MNNARLTDDATAKLAKLEALLTELDLDRTQAFALLWATQIAEEVNDPDAFEQGKPEQTLTECIENWQENAHAVWEDVLEALPPFIIVA